MRMPANKSIPFQNERFTDVVTGEQSWQLVYLRASICPCRNPKDGTPTRACPHCHGYGYTWAQPQSRTVVETFYAGSTTRPARLAYSFVSAESITSVETSAGQTIGWTLTDGIVIPDPPLPVGDEFVVEYTIPETIQGLVTRLTSKQDWREVGIVDLRDLHLTVTSMYDTPDGERIPNPAWSCAEHDRFVIPEARVRMQDLKRRGQEDHLTYSWVYSIERVFSISPESGMPVIEYEQDEDYTLDGGTITWQAGKGPRVGHHYAVIYDAAPEFYVRVNLPHMRHEGGKNLPRAVLLSSWEIYAKPGVSQTRSP